ncbi:uncharacterized protein LOC108096906 [Drosophila ficusphila]|uniref:uncharacterized protein LOC108096906 n=1 Tax=Drosophila ficusphila TaxID=30025 RepID=UPI0007E7C769|nr:uncharacterized protein LOC108096906 [Drosophila ficusphila]XP_017054344.1 uncharacterized protein LOC108096906 [Drosophila ficusphila]
MNFLLILCAFSVLPAFGRGGAVQETLDIVRVLREVTNTILKTWDLFEKMPVAEVTAAAAIYDKQRQIIERIEEVNDHIRNFEEKQTRDTVVIINTLLREMQVNSQVLHRLNQLKDLTKYIDLRHDQLEGYENYTDKLHPSTLINFAKWNVDPGSNSLSLLLQLLNECLYVDNSLLSTPDFKHSLLWELTASFEASPEQMCLARQSAQQFAYQIFTKAVLTELKGYSIIEFSWMILRQSGRGNFTQELLLMRESHHKRMDRAVEVLLLVMNNSSRSYWRCDPEKGGHVEGETFDRVTRFMQGFVENEVNLNEEKSCKGSCPDYHDTRSSGCYQPEEEFCGQQPACKGRIYNCDLLDTDISICLSSNDSIRRYKYIDFKGGDQNQQCDSPEKKPASWSSWVFWRCHYCFCLCDEQGPMSDRFFNLRDSMSDYAQNKIVTGIKFVKKNRVFHLQLQQSELLPLGSINGSSQEWLPIDAYNVSDVDIRDGYDYHTLTPDSRALDLDEISAKSWNDVVTGVRFRIFNKHLNLEVRFSSFNFSSGRLIEPQTKSYWLGNDKSHHEGQRRKFVLKEGDLPTNSEFPSVPLSKNDQYMEFTSSSQLKDAAQNAVPFVDVQEVVPDIATPLAGVGIYYKGRPGYGGFFAPKVITFDLTKRWNAFL